MKILISQKTPSNMAAYNAITEKYGATIEFHQFFLIEPVTSKEFRAQKINLADYTAVLFSSRHAIDAYFKLCDEMRFKVPETMKYFCTTEMVATYLQKHVVYRKRKIFFGDGTPESVVGLIGPKHKGEKFLVSTTEGANSSAVSTLLDKAGVDYTVSVLVKPVSQDLTGINLNDYSAIVVYNPSDIKSLYESYPDFQQGDLHFISYGRSIVKALDEAGLKAEVQAAPGTEVTSVAKALDIYLSKLK